MQLSSYFLPDLLSPAWLLDLTYLINSDFVNKFWRIIVRIADASLQNLSLTGCQATFWSFDSEFLN